jgi:hypothetical protein
LLVTGLFHKNQVNTLLSEWDTSLIWWEKMIFHSCSSKRNLNVSIIFWELIFESICSVICNFKIFGKYL